MSEDDPNTDLSLVKVNATDLAGAEHWAKHLAPIANASGKTIDAVRDGAIALARTLFGPAAGSLGLLLQDKVNEWRATNAIAIVARLQKQMERAGMRPLEGQHAHPRAVLEFLDKGTRAPDENLQEMWAGLLQRSIGEGEKDDSTLPYMRILDGLTSRQAAILKYVCDRYPRSIAPLAPNPEQVFVSLGELQSVFPGKDLADFNFDILHLRQLDLLVRIMSDHAFHLRPGSNSQELHANLTPSIRGVQFIAAREGIALDHSGSKDSHS